MDEFGRFKPTGRNRLFLFLVAMGLGRGKLKRVFSRYWQAATPQAAVDIDYHGLHLRLRPVGNTIESKILFSSRLREAEELAEFVSALPVEAALSISVPMLAITR